MPRVGFLLITILLILSLDWYVYSGLRSIVYEVSVFSYVYWTISVLVVFGFIQVAVDLARKKVDVIRSVSSNLLLGFGFAVVVGKIIFAGLLGIQDLGLLLINLTGWVVALLSDSGWNFTSRNMVLVICSAIAAAVPFISMLYGITLGKYQFEVENVQLKFPDLPRAFDGFKVLQISDIHAGSFDSQEQVKKGIDLMRQQKADLILFTGDLVNSLKEEIDPYLEIFAQLQAPYGMFSVTGNHDYYGMYQVAQKDPIARNIYMTDFAAKHAQIGFELLNNTSTKIHKDGASIRIIGVENWGAGPFPKKGDLDQALANVEANEFSILLSHDPTHWDHHVLKHPKQIHLTLSGHTHGMQFGIKWGKFRWSPVKYRYKRWIGLYEEAQQHLYVNRGFGFLAWPGRVGMTPEITVFELQSV